MNNMCIYEDTRSVPLAAQKTIGAGRLKGMTDINPMWRIQKLTEKFGPCGVGWAYEITDKHLETTSDMEVAAFVDINLYVKIDGDWSRAIPGTGGSMFVANEKAGPHTSDECFKMALTDALSVSCKALGFGADVYFAGGKSKYETPAEDATPESYACEKCGKEFTAFEYNGKQYTARDAYEGAKRKNNGKALCKECRNEALNADNTSAV